MNEIDTSGFEIWLALRKAFTALEMHAVKSILELDMCTSDFAVLAFLLQKGGLPVNTLGKELLLTSGSITIAIDRLERRGLVQRQWQSHDRRVCLVILTPEGDKLIKATFEKNTADLLQAISGLTRAERKNLATLLEKLSVTTQSLYSGQQREESTASSRQEKESAPSTKIPASPKEVTNSESGFTGFTGLD